MYYPYNSLNSNVLNTITANNRASSSYSNVSVPYSASNNTVPEHFSGPSNNSSTSYSGPSNTVSDHYSGASINDSTTHSGPNNTVFDHYSGASNTVSDHYSGPSNNSSTSYSGPTNTVSDHYSGASNNSSTSYSGSNNTVSDHYSGASNNSSTSFGGPNNTVSDHYSGPSNNNLTTHSGPNNTVFDHYSGPNNNSSTSYSGPTKTVSDHYSGPSNNSSTAYSGPNNTVSDHYTGPRNNNSTTQSGPNNTVFDHYSGPSNNSSTSYSGPNKTVSDYYSGPSNNSSTTQRGPNNTVSDHYSGPSNNSSTSYSGPNNTVSDHYSGPINSSLNSYSGPRNTDSDHYSGPSNTDPDHYSGPRITVPDHYSGPRITVPEHYSGPSNNSSNPPSGPNNTIPEHYSGPNNTDFDHCCGPRIHISYNYSGPSNTVSDHYSGRSITGSTSYSGPSNNGSTSYSGPSNTVSDHYSGPQNIGSTSYSGLNNAVSDHYSGSNNVSKPYTTQSNKIPCTNSVPSNVPDTYSEPSNNVPVNYSGPSNVLDTYSAPTNVPDTYKAPSNNVLDTYRTPSNVSDIYSGSSNVLDTYSAPRNLSNTYSMPRNVSDICNAPSNNIPNTNKAPNNVSDTYSGPSNNMSDTVYGGQMELDSEMYSYSSAQRQSHRPPSTTNYANTDVAGPSSSTMHSIAMHEDITPPFAPVASGYTRFRVILRSLALHIFNIVKDIHYLRQWEISHNMHEHLEKLSFAVAKLRSEMPAIHRSLLSFYPASEFIPALFFELNRMQGAQDYKITLEVVDYLYYVLLEADDEFVSYLQTRGMVAHDLNYHYELICRNLVSLTIDVLYFFTIVPRRLQNNWDQSLHPSAYRHARAFDPPPYQMPPVPPINVAPPVHPQTNVAAESANKLRKRAYKRKMKAEAAMHRELTSEQHTVQWHPQPDGSRQSSSKAMLTTPEGVTIQTDKSYLGSKRNHNDQSGFPFEISAHSQTGKRFNLPNGNELKSLKPKATTSYNATASNVLPLTSSFSPDIRKGHDFYAQDTIVGQQLASTANNFVPTQLTSLDASRRYSLLNGRQFTESPQRIAPSSNSAFTEPNPRSELPHLPYAHSGNPSVPLETGGVSQTTASISNNLVPVFPSMSSNQQFKTGLQCTLDCCTNVRPMSGYNANQSVGIDSCYVPPNVGAHMTSNEFQLNLPHLRQPPPYPFPPVANMRPQLPISMHHYNTYQRQPYRFLPSSHEYNKVNEQKASPQAARNTLESSELQSFFRDMNELIGSKQVDPSDVEDPVSSSRDSDNTDSNGKPKATLDNLLPENHPKWCDCDEISDPATLHKDTCVNRQATSYQDLGPTPVSSISEMDSVVQPAQQAESDPVGDVTPVPLPPDTTSPLRTPPLYTVPLPPETTAPLRHTVPLPPDTAALMYTVRLIEQQAAATAAGNVVTCSAPSQHRRKKISSRCYQALHGFKITPTTPTRVYSGKAAGTARKDDSKCMNCGDISKFPCTRCNGVFYCSKECQCNHWERTHQDECETPR